ncbi:hypothetical protein MJG53_016923 [Ovis ammon polii x Ovis aries]|uniref:Uncharacterized protein n=1 Tax=Ovis ammon polii x Ovis aries TaxID=2918886 RepID=A0ACB9U9H4_9CETA|nr:hypothetical protein MJG53_016923 [Ovis ammon polii x Ovis aries]
MRGNGNPLQYSCLKNPMDGGSWWATVHGVAKSWTQLSDFTFLSFRKTNPAQDYFLLNLVYYPVLLRFYFYLNLSSIWTFAITLSNWQPAYRPCTLLVYVPVPHLSAHVAAPVPHTVALCPTMW